MRAERPALRNFPLDARTHSALLHKDPGNAAAAYRRANVWRSSRAQFVTPARARSVLRRKIVITISPLFNDDFARRRVSVSINLAHLFSYKTLPCVPLELPEGQAKVEKFENS